ncbi:hypothetical protein LSTR_LSTR007632 [Laodelphax striatellus]|uniref:Uncharacterized protein n=1 Tax=Laodelphax striatellus TaxID=195883 RepID=A0A482WIE0_LAOST|nr:hypothetical protein LSTR_LSTR007632 [Laodelphax striatellus]
MSLFPYSFSTPSTRVVFGLRFRLDLAYVSDLDSMTNLEELVSILNQLIQKELERSSRIGYWISERGSIAFIDMESALFLLKQSTSINQRFDQSHVFDTDFLPSTRIECER